MQIQIRYFNDKIKPLCYVEDKSDWIDLRCAETVEMKRGEYRKIPLGVAMRLPAGYEALVAPRSSTFEKFGILQANSVGVIDESYCGPNDQWQFPAYAVRDTIIHAGERVCQFRVIEHQPHLEFLPRESWDAPDRGGFCTTGTQ